MGASSVNLKIGEKIPASLTLKSRLTTKFVRATIVDNAETPITGSPVTLAHSGGGIYFSDSVAMPNVPNIIVRYEIYNDALFTIVSEDDLPEDERFDLDELASILDDLESLVKGASGQAIAATVDAGVEIATVAEAAEILNIKEESPTLAIDTDDDSTEATLRNETSSEATLEGCD